MKFYRCPVCGSVASTLLRSLRGKREKDVATRIQRRLPSWNLAQGLCERCLYLNEFDTLEEHFASRAKGSLFRDRVRNEFALLPTSLRLNADPRFTGRGITIAFLDSGFYPHPDLKKPVNRIRALVDVTDSSRTEKYFQSPHVESWHGTMTSVAAAGNGHLSRGLYRGIASEATAVLVKVMDSATRRVSTQNLAKGIRWVIEHRREFNIGILSISVGDDDPTPSSESPVNQAAEEAVAAGIVVIAAGGNDPSRPIVPPASAHSVITVGGMDDRNELNTGLRGMYHSTYGKTVDGDEKPELIAPAIWVAAPILPHTDQYHESKTLFAILRSTTRTISKILERERNARRDIPQGIEHGDYKGWAREKISEMHYCAPYYKGVDGTSFAAPIVSSVVAQMLQANPLLSHKTIKELLIHTAEPIADIPREQQGGGALEPSKAVSSALTALANGVHFSHSLPNNQVGKRGAIFVCFEEADTVAVAGDFNEWNSEGDRLHEVVAGQWAGVVHLPAPGRYRYKFVLNGDKWINDAQNPAQDPDGFGGQNSILTTD